MWLDGRRGRGSRCFGPSSSCAALVTSSSGKNGYTPLFVIPGANAGRRTGADITGRERTATMMDILFHGVGWTDIALTFNRIAVGMFFMLSGYHKLFNPERHRAFADELKELGVHAVGFNQWWVPTIEFSAGGAVVIGLLAPLAALGLLVIILVAIATSGRQRIKDYKPIDEADRIDDWLYLPEVLYAFMLIVVVSAGAGPYSLDALIVGLIDKHGA
jgi:uncharacterized membrane protein YphA (DoxX/SURF4 family)